MSLPNLVGQVLGQYEIRELLGVGGMGAVYRARQLLLKRSVALKVLSPTLANQAGYIDRFIREAETAASLEHNHIVPIYDFGAERESPYIVMRLLTGATLAERIQYSLEKEDPLPSLTEISRMLQQVSSALDYAHGLGIIHRDIKPSNVMFDDRGSAYLVDFGIAKIMEASSGLTGSGMSMGTPAYMAPEQWRNEPLTPAADLYALGIITYQLLTGTAPFRATTPYGYMHLHLHEMPPPPHSLDAEVPEGISPVLERAIAKDAAARFASATAFADAFHAALDSRELNTTTFFTKPIPRRRATGGFGSSGAGVSPAPDARLAHSPVWVVAVLVLAAALIVVLVLIMQPGAGAPEEEAGVATVPPIEPTLPTGRSGAEVPLAVIVATNTPSVTEPVFVILVPEATETLRPSPQATQTPSITPTHTPETTQTLTPTAPPTATRMVEPSATPTLSPTVAATSTAVFTATPLPTSTATVTVSPSPTRSVTRTSTASMTPAPTSSPTALPTSTTNVSRTPMRTATATPSFTRTPTPSPTASPSPTSTRTPIPTATHTPTSTATLTLVPSLTSTASTTPSPTISLTPTRRAIPTATATPSPEPTSSPTPCQLADVNGDGEVDIFDIRIVATNYGREVAGDSSLSSLDFNNSGVIDILDVRRVTSQYGSVCQ